MGKVKSQKTKTTSTTKTKTTSTVKPIAPVEVIEPEVIEPEVVEDLAEDEIELTEEEQEQINKILIALCYINSILKKYPLVEVLLPEDDEVSEVEDYQTLYDNKEALVKEYFSYRIYNPTRRFVTFEQGINEILKKCK